MTRACPSGRADKEKCARRVRPQSRSSLAASARPTGYIYIYICMYRYIGTKIAGGRIVRLRRLSPGFGLRLQLSSALALQPPACNSTHLCQAVGLPRRRRAPASHLNARVAATGSTRDFLRADCGPPARPANSRPPTSTRTRPRWPRAARRWATTGRRRRGPPVSRAARLWAKGEWGALVEMLKLWNGLGGQSGMQ